MLYSSTVLCGQQASWSTLQRLKIEYHKNSEAQCGARSGRGKVCKPWLQSGLRANIQPIVVLNSKRPTLTDSLPLVKRNEAKELRTSIPLLLAL